jgi:DNA-binding transcriptional LysR family regulator
LFQPSNGGRVQLPELQVDLDLSLTTDFLVLARARSYRQAAARLVMTPSALSKRVSRLEHQVGVALVQRPALGPVLLTTAGVRFAEAAVQLLQHAEWARHQAIVAAQPTVIRIGYHQRPRPSRHR